MRTRRTLRHTLQCPHCRKIAPAGTIICRCGHQFHPTQDIHIQTPRSTLFTWHTLRPIILLDTAVALIPPLLSLLLALLGARPIATGLLLIYTLPGQLLAFSLRALYHLIIGLDGDKNDGPDGLPPPPPVFRPLADITQVTLADLPTLLLCALTWIIITTNLWLLLRPRAKKDTHPRAIDPSALISPDQHIRRQRRRRRRTPTDPEP